MNQLIAQDLPETDWTDYADTSWYDASLNDFEIDNAEGFAGLSVLVANGEDFENKSIRLTSNLDLGEHLWQPIGLNIENSFKGELDGAGSCDFESIHKYAHLRFCRVIWFGFISFI